MINKHIIILADRDENELAAGFIHHDPQIILEWSAVIAALGGNYTVDRFENGLWVVFTDTEKLDYFAREINEYENERPIFEQHRKRHTTPAANEPLRDETSYTPLYISLFLLITHIFTGRVSDNTFFMQSGVFDIEKFLNGQWWRPVTSLTLHADILHLVSNLCFFVFLTPFLCRMLGTTLSCFLILLSGISGNIMMIPFVSLPHTSLGSSTAVFGNLGILVGLSILMKLSNRRKTEAGKPLIAGLCLVVITGLSPEVDYTAHICGFISGIILGGAAFFIKRKNKSILLNAMIWSITAGTLYLSWYCAKP